MLAVKRKVDDVFAITERSNVFFINFFVQGGRVKKKMMILRMQENKTSTYIKRTLIFLLSDGYESKSE